MKRTAFKIELKCRGHDHISQVSGWDSMSCWRRAEGTYSLRGILALLRFDTHIHQHATIPSPDEKHYRSCS